MKIQIREREVALTLAVRTHVEQRLGMALGRFANEIERVSVRFSNVAGDNGSEKRCEIDVSLRPRNVHVEDTDAQLVLAVDRASGRVSRLVSRARENHRS